MKGPHDDDDDDDRVRSDGVLPFLLRQIEVFGIAFLSYTVEYTHRERGANERMEEKKGERLNENRIWTWMSTGWWL